MKCQSCEQDKAKLHVVQSEIVPSLDLKLCASCKFDNLEPRFVIILGARSGADRDKIKEVVRERRYLGKEITLHEVLA